MLLIIVCCHAVYSPITIGPYKPYNQCNWLLKDFQQSNSETHKPCEHHTFVKHIQAGWQLYLEKEASDTELFHAGKKEEMDGVLVFSGGATAKNVKTPEATSYLEALKDLANENEYFEKQKFIDGCHKGIVITEQHATDSYQNLLFSLVEYWKEIGDWPDQIIVITHAFKQRRFLELHAPAIKWPAEKIRVMGINPPFTREELDTVVSNEQRNAYNLFVQDPYGTSPPLSHKREERNWDPATLKEICATVFGPGITKTPLPEAVKNLLMWKSEEGEFTEKLPWEE